MIITNAFKWAFGEKWGSIMIEIILWMFVIRTILQMITDIFNL